MSRGGNEVGTRMRVREATEADQGQTERDAFLARGSNRRSITDPHLALYHWDVGVDAGVMLDSRRVPCSRPTRGHQVSRRWTRQVWGCAIAQSQEQSPTVSSATSLRRAVCIHARIADEVTAFVQQEARS